VGRAPARVGGHGRLLKLMAPYSPARRLVGSAFALTPWGSVLSWRLWWFYKTSDGDGEGITCRRRLSLSRGWLVISYCRAGEL
jgi:hypothetical protein